MKERNTKQKDLILDILRRVENKNHPTILEIVDKVSLELPSIGQATIYRNIKKLVKDGKLKKIATNSGYRYDIDTLEHGHLVCNKCNKVFDVYDSNYKRFIKRIGGNNHVIINDSDFIFYGICEDCK